VDGLAAAKAVARATGRVLPAYLVGRMTRLPSDPQARKLPWVRAREGVPVSGPVQELAEEMIVRRRHIGCLGKPPSRQCVP
jgi:hypothetical protein